MQTHQIILLICVGLGMFAVIGGLSLLAHYYTLNGIKSKTVGDGQHGTARFATEKEIRDTYAQVAYEPERWRHGEALPEVQGLVVGYKGHGSAITALVDSGDIHCLMIGAAGVGKTANFLYPNIEYACASGMSWLCTDTKGDLFRNYAGIAKDCYGYQVSKAVELFRQAADQENQFAQYQLGKLYLSGEHLPKDVDAAIHWLEKAAAQENQYAQYTLGKLYLCGHDVPRDKEKAVPLLEASAAQGNIYAQFLLDHIESFRDSSPFLAATRLLHRLENLFREDIRKAAGGTAYHIDRKRRRRLAEKKQAQGHKRDDREPVQQQTY